MTITLNVLTTDLTQTTDVHIFREQLKEAREINRIAKENATDPEAMRIAEAGEIEAQTLLDEYDQSPTGPVFVVRFLPPGLVVDFDMQRAATTRGVNFDEPLSLEVTRELYRISKSEIRWGVVGIYNCDDVVYESEVDTYEGVSYDVASRPVMDFIERNRWVHILRDAIMRYNVVGEEKKRQLPSAPSTDPTTSTVDCASASPD